MTADPYTASGGPVDPGSWNRYAYTVGDPVNRLDPTGLDYCEGDNCDGGGGGGYDPTGYRPPSEQSCGGFPGFSGSGSPGSGGGGSGRFVPPVTLGEGADLLNLQLGGAITGWTDFTSGIEIGITAGDWELISGICVAQPEVCVLVAGGLSIYVAYQYGPALIQAIESRGRQGNVADSGVLEEAYGLMQEAKLKGQQLDICGALAQLANMAAGDTQKLQKSKKTQKQFNCRPSRQSPNR